MKVMDVMTDSGRHVIKMRSWEEIHGISLCMITLNEEEFARQTIDHHKGYVKYVAIVDGGSTDNTMSSVSKYADAMRVIKFSGHFGNQKNRCIELAETDWVLFLDADEKMSPDALKSLDGFINQNEYDCYAFPRKNFIDGEPDLSNGDDYQLRLFRSYCRYVRPIHEELVGFKNKKVIDPGSGIYIEHRKRRKRHDIRNASYSAYDSMFIHETGTPATQSKDLFTKDKKTYFDMVNAVNQNKENQ